MKLTHYVDEFFWDNGIKKAFHIYIKFILFFKKIYLPGANTQIRLQSFFYRVPRLYSKLPENIRKQTPIQFTKLFIRYI